DCRARVILLSFGYSHSKTFTWHGQGNEDRQAVVTRHGFASECQSICRYFNDVAEVRRILFHWFTITGRSCLQIEEAKAGNLIDFTQPPRYEVEHCRLIDLLVHLLAVRAKLRLCFRSNLLHLFFARSGGRAFQDHPVDRVQIPLDGLSEHLLRAFDVGGDLLQSGACTGDSLIQLRAIRLCALSQLFIATREEFEENILWEGLFLVLRARALASTGRVVGDRFGGAAAYL